VIVGPSILATRHMNLSQSTSVDNRIKDISPFTMAHSFIFFIGKSQQIEVSSYQNW
jgi:hypothetical protein